MHQYVVHIALMSKSVRWCAACSTAERVANDVVELVCLCKDRARRATTVTFARCLCLLGGLTIVGGPCIGLGQLCGPVTALLHEA